MPSTNHQSADYVRKLPLGVSIVLALLVAGFELSSTAAFAEDYLRDPTVVIERHDKRSSKYRFAGDDGKDPNQMWSITYEGSIYKAPSPDEARVLSYEALPACDKSEVKLIDLQTPGSPTRAQDIIYYSAEDSGQSAKAALFPHLAVAYEPALVRDPKTNEAPFPQMFARFLRIRCLPTRFRFIQVGSKRYAEFRTGKEVWKAE